jgi:hypothetical protein
MHKLQVQNYMLKITSYNFQFTSYRVSIYANVLRTKVETTAWAYIYQVSKPERFLLLPTLKTDRFFPTLKTNSL